MNPQTLNKYAYVLNNPLRFIDPDGHQAAQDWITMLLRWFMRQLDPQTEAEEPRRGGPLSLDADKVTAKYAMEVANNAWTAFEWGEALGIDFGVTELARQMDRKDAVGTAAAAGFLAANVISLGRGGQATKLEEMAGQQLHKRFNVLKGESIAPYAKMADWLAESKDKSRGIVMEVFTGTNKSISQNLGLLTRAGKMSGAATGSGSSNQSMALRSSRSKFSNPDYTTV